MKTSENLGKITQALFNAQSNIKHALKDAQNKHLNSTYATLESIIDATKDALLKEGVLVLQYVENKVLHTRLLHTSGEFIDTQLELLIQKADMQGLGSAITYARKFSLAALLNMSQSDDDGNATTKGDKKARVLTNKTLPDSPSKDKPTTPVVKKDSLPF